MEIILSKEWGWGPFGLVLKEWSISFDPLRDSKTPSKIWAILPNLPLVFWNDQIFQSIGNKFSSYLSNEPGWEVKEDHGWAWSNFL
jgi:hypothetical protein